MEEIHSQSDHYRSSSSSTSSPVRRVPSSNFFYLRKLGALRQPISFEDSPVWDDTDIEVKVEEGGGDSINAATTPGKSSLLRALAGRLPYLARMYGEVHINGVKSHMPYGSYGFVERETTLIGSLTVREFLYYSALLQLPGFFFQKRSVVEDSILAMLLGEYANKLLGGHCYMKCLCTPDDGYLEEAGKHPMHSDIHR